MCYNFCYREPQDAIELLLHWFIASEIGIATSIQRVRLTRALGETSLTRPSRAVAL